MNADDGYAYVVVAQSTKSIIASFDYLVWVWY